MNQSFKKPKEIKEPKKGSQISIRMTSLERKLIESKAKDSGYSMSRFMVNSALGKNLKVLSSEEKEAYINLAKYHTNFSRISSLFKEKKEVLAELENVMNEIKTHLNQLKNGKSS